MKLLVFTRYPESGCVKTRLIPALGPAGARELHRSMAEHALQRLDCFTNIEVCFDGGSKQCMRHWLGGSFSYIPQGGGNLGQRMLRACSRTFQQGEDKVILVGTDCPGLKASHVRKALHLLDKHDLVLGPAADGGYYLLGLKDLYAGLFEDIPWGTGQVLAETLQKAHRLGLRTVLLEELADIDRPEDLCIWEKIKEHEKSKTEKEP